MASVKIDSGQFRSVEGLDDRRDVMMVVNWWQKTAYSYPEKTEWIIQMYDEAKKYELHKQYGCNTLEEFMAKEVLFKYDVAAREIEELLTRIRNGELTALSKHGEIGNGRSRDGNTKSTNGTDAKYKIRRLKRDAPEIAEEVIKGDISANAGFIKAGLGRKKITIEPTVEGFSKAILKHLNDTQIKELMIIL